MTSLGESSGPLTGATRAEALRITREQIATTGALLEQVVARRLASEEYGRLVTPEVSNAQELALQVQFDIGCLLNDMFTHDPSARARFYARLLILTMREASKTMPQVLGPAFRARMAERLGPDIDRRLRDVHARLTALFRDVEAQFGDVRDGIVAHLDRDADRRLMLLGQVGTEPVAQLAIQLGEALNPLSGIFLEYLEALVTEAGRPRA